MEEKNMVGKRIDDEALEEVAGGVSQENFRSAPNWFETADTKKNDMNNESASNGYTALSNMR